MLAPLALAAAFLCVYPDVHDGDTFRCHDGPRVRVWGIDAPELKTPAGPASTRALRQLVAGKILTCVPKGHSYDRVVALCTVNGRDIAAEMVLGGWAVDWPKYSHGRYAKP
jgi:endonuclease YncB( thermonuclease family)